MLDKIAEPHQYQDFIDRIIAYGGGGTVFTASSLVESAESTPVADWALWISAMVLLGRFAFDVYKYFFPRDKN